MWTLPLLIRFNLVTPILSLSENSLVLNLLSFAMKHLPFLLFRNANGYLPMKVMSPTNFRLQYSFRFFSKTNGGVLCDKQSNTTVPGSIFLNIQPTCRYS